MFRSGRIAPVGLVEDSSSPSNASSKQHNPSAPEAAIIQAGCQLVSTGCNHQQQVSRCIEWFRATFTKAARYQGKVTLRDFKQVSREGEGFADNLFLLFDTDHNGSVTLQELVGGLSRLSKHHNTKKLLQFFEQRFVQVSGEDSLLQLDEFREAIRQPLFVENLFRLIDPSNSGKVALRDLMDSFEKLTV